MVTGLCIINIYISIKISINSPKIFHYVKKMTHNQKTQSLKPSIFDPIKVIFHLMKTSLVHLFSHYSKNSKRNGTHMFLRSINILPGPNFFPHGTSYHPTDPSNP